jgi:hypothetical protein
MIPAFGGLDLLASPLLQLVRNASRPSTLFQDSALPALEFHLIAGCDVLPVSSGGLPEGIPLLGDQTHSDNDSASALFPEPSTDAEAGSVKVDSSLRRIHAVLNV